MATVNFSVPEEVKAAFDRTFRGRNKSAVLAELMRKAVLEEEQRVRREAIFRELTKLRGSRPAVVDRRIRASRRAGRP